jgi:diaminopimelate epimerase
VKIAFTKMHGLGNDFVVIDATKKPFPADPVLLRRFGDRHFGVGCDQIVVLAPASTGAVDFDYRIYNADGGESGMSGNGSRCIGVFIRERKLSRKDRIKLKTRTTAIELQLLPDGQVRVDAGVPRFLPTEVPLVAKARAPRYEVKLRDGGVYEAGAVSMGNPHAVIETKDVATAPVEAVGAALQAHAMFPQKVNVGFLQVVDSERAKLRVYERGAGETLACGSGACGAMAVGRTWGKLGPKVAMELRGGTLELEWKGEGQALYMTGPAVTVYEGEIEWQGS